MRLEKRRKEQKRIANLLKETETMVNYEEFTKEELIRIIRLYMRILNSYINTMDELIYVFHYLDGVEIDCPEKRCQQLVNSTTKEAFKTLKEVSKLIKKHQKVDASKK